MSPVLAFPENFLWGVQVPFQGNPPTSDRAPDVAGLLSTWPPGGLAHMVLDWSRLEPEEGRLENSALAESTEFLRALRSRGWKTAATLVGMTLPAWALSRGGWSNPRILDRFDLYAAWCGARLGKNLDFWSTIQRPVWAALGKAPWNPLTPRELWAAWPALANVLSAHGRAYRILKRESSGVPVGLCHALDGMGPLRPDWGPDRWIAGIMDSLASQSVLDALSLGSFSSPFGKFRVPEAKGTLDYLGLAYRTGILWALSLAHPQQCFMSRARVPGIPRGAGGDDIFPAGLSPALRRARSLGKPVLVLDNGVVDGPDTIRPGALVAHLAELHAALPGEPPVLGYVYGPLLDGIESGTGAKIPDGLCADLGPKLGVEARPSALFFADIWRENAMPGILTRQFGAPFLRGGSA